MFKRSVLSLTTLVLLAACSQEPDGSAVTQAAAGPAPAHAADTGAAGSSAAPSEQAEAGERIYKQTCAMCHASGVAGAPVPGAAADWEPRIAQGKNVLYQHALEGFTGEKGMMPAKGGNPSLSDAEVNAAVDYMVAQ